MIEMMKQRIKMKKKLFIIDEAKKLKLTAVIVSTMIIDMQNTNY